MNSIVVVASSRQWRGCDLNAAGVCNPAAAAAMAFSASECALLFRCCI